MNCIICGKGMKEGITLFRINPKGRKGVWACRQHRDELGIPKDDIVDDIVKLIEDHNKQI